MADTAQTTSGTTVPQEGGFPPFMLEPLDFAGIYASRRAAAQGQPIGQA